MSRRPKPLPKPDLERLEQALGHRFADRMLLDRALTHVSALSQPGAAAQAEAGQGGSAAASVRIGSYQRLEFLGDRVLGVVIADLLFRSFPGDEEGALSRRLAALVRKEACAEVAVAWGVGPHLRLGLGESHSGGRKRLTILGDVCEALIGAVFSDGGYEAAKEVVEAAWSDRLLAVDRPPSDAKTALQEWAQARALASPTYRVVARTGPDHNPRFIVAVDVPTLPSAEGGGSSKRLAEQAAAEAFIRRDRIPFGIPPLAAASRDDPMSHESTRCGFVALIGAPNAGKSTLMNALVGAKLSIVTHKVQTTRAIVRGIAMDGPGQVVFVDTPGIFAPRRRLDRAMVTTAWSGAADADLVCLLVDAARGLDDANQAILDRLAETRQPKVLVLNKIDAVRPERLLELAAALNARVPFEDTFMVSALTGSGTGDLLRALAARMPEGPWLYPEDQISDAPIRALAAEITREKLFLRLHDEIPYESTVETDQWQVRGDGSARVEQTIYVNREGQRKIVIGRGGETIKAISMAARKEIAEIAEAPVHLFLFVKVRENWADDPQRYREMGLEFPHEKR